MESFTDRNDRSERQRCSCCNHPLRLLEDPRSLALFMEVKSAQRRALRCMNCGQVICRDCRLDGFRCACGCNAWVALPYLESAAVKSTEHQVA
jgi:hypothetical protein